MNKNTSVLFYLFITAMITGCQSMGGISMDEASKLALETSKTTPQKPEYSFTELKELFNKTTPKPLNCSEYNASIEQQKQRAIKLLRTKANIGGIGAEVAMLASRYLKTGYTKQAIDLATQGYYLLEGRGVGIRQAILASSISRMYAYQGEKLYATTWASNASQKWKTPWMNQGMGVANRNSVKAGLAYLEDNLLAEEYFLKQAQGSIWSGRTQMKTAINVDYAFARLAENLNTQGRSLEAEYFVREYLYLLKKFSFSKTYYPLLMQQLSEALFAQNRLDDALWAAQRSLIGHKNNCSKTDSTVYEKARQTENKILLAIKKQN